VRDRASYEFALVSVAAAFAMRNGAIKDPRIVLGAVAHKPWRATEAETMIANQPPGAEVFQAAARKALEGAKPYRDNQFKVELAQRAIVRALAVAGGLA